MPAIEERRIREALGRVGLDVEVVPEIGSTNQALVERPFGSAPARPRLLAAERQTGGRGRRGRGWIADPERSAAFSLAFERPAGPPPVGLPIAVGVAVLAALEGWVGGLALKWPNDLQRGGRKAGGILIETRRSAGHPPVERIVVGIGLNLLEPLDAGARIGQPAAGLFDGLEPPDRSEVIGRVAASVAEAFARFESAGLAPFAERWNAHDALAGRRVVVLDDGRTIAQGVARGLDADGALRIETASGLRSFSVGDVSLRADDAFAEAPR